MKHTREEILNALHIIKDTCDEINDGDCPKCPFCDKQWNCIICKQSPHYWDIKDDEPWRAFE